MSTNMKKQCLKLSTFEPSLTKNIHEDSDGSFTERSLKTKPIRTQVKLVLDATHRESQKHQKLKGYKEVLNGNLRNPTKIDVETVDIKENSPNTLSLPKINDSRVCSVTERPCSDNRKNDICEENENKKIVPNDFQEDERKKIGDRRKKNVQNQFKFTKESFETFKTFKTMEDFENINDIKQKLMNSVPCSQFSSIPSEYHKLVEVKQIKEFLSEDLADFVFLDEKFYKRIFPKNRPYTADQFEFLKHFLVEKYSQLPSVADTNANLDVVTRLLKEESDVLLNIVFEISRQIKVRSVERGEMLDASIDRLRQLLGVSSTLLTDLKKRREGDLVEMKTNLDNMNVSFAKERELHLKQKEQYESIINDQQRIIENKQAEIDSFKQMFNDPHLSSSIDDVSFEKVVMDSILYLNQICEDEKVGVFSNNNVDKDKGAMNFDELSTLMTERCHDKALQEQIKIIQKELENTQLKLTERNDELSSTKKKLQQSDALLNRLIGNGTINAIVEIPSDNSSTSIKEESESDEVSELKVEKLKITSKIFDLKDKINTITKIRSEEWDTYLKTKDELLLDNILKIREKRKDKGVKINTNSNQLSVLNIEKIQLSLLNSYFVRLTKKLEHVTDATISFKIFEELPIFKQYNPSLIQYKQCRVLETKVLELLRFNSDVRVILCEKLNELPVLFLKFLRNTFWVRNSFDGYESINLKAHEVFNNFLALNFEQIVDPFLEKCEIFNVKDATFKSILFIRLNITIVKIFSENVNVLAKTFLNVVCSSVEGYLEYLKSLDLFNPNVQLAEIKNKLTKSTITIETQYLNLIEHVNSHSSIFGSDLIFPPLAFLLMEHLYGLTSDIPYKQMFNPSSFQGLPNAIFGDQFGILLKVLFGTSLSNARYKAIMKFIMNYRDYKITSFQKDVLCGTPPKGKIMSTNVSLVPFDHCLLFVLYEYNNVTLKQMYDFRQILENTHESASMFISQTYCFDEFNETISKLSNSVSSIKLANIWMNTHANYPKQRNHDEYHLIMDKFIDKSANGEFISGKKALIDFDTENQQRIKNLTYNIMTLDCTKLFEIILSNPSISKMFALPLVNIGPTLVATIKIDEVTDMLADARSLIFNFEKVFETVSEHPTLLNRNFNSAKIFYEKLQIVLMSHSFPITTVLLINKVINLLVSGVLEIQSSTGLYDFSSILEVQNFNDLFDKTFNEGSLRALEYSKSNPQAFSVTQFINSLIKLQRQYRSIFKKTEVKPNLSKSNSLLLLTT
eukprot:TRINITY_DN2538_c0_g1_i1.p1 TRINITY_DN2538_c0_g1~~TRINITY_DN2538_c0_g1_i1.p1  ORF type:complete len:1251 (-),score=294.92 TRINITY_DN2538_c0_g1_i1:16-3768(-)